jgi:hypothetical protein
VDSLIDQTAKLVALISGDQNSEEAENHVLATISNNNAIPQFHLGQPSERTVQVKVDFNLTD